MTSEDEFDALPVPDIDEDQWGNLEASHIRGLRLPPPSSAPGGNISLGGSMEGVEQDIGDLQPIIGTQSTFSDGCSYFDSFTESQQASLDQILASSQLPVQASSGSHHPLEGSSNFDIEDDMPHTRKSLMQLFRPSGTLSVTDLVLPIWWAICLPVVSDTLCAAFSFVTTGVN